MRAKKCVWDQGVLGRAEGIRSLDQPQRGPTSLRLHRAEYGKTIMLISVTALTDPSSGKGQCDDLQHVGNTCQFLWL